MIYPVGSEGCRCSSSRGCELPAVRFYVTFCRDTFPARPFRTRSLRIPWPVQPLRSCPLQVLWRRKDAAPYVSSAVLYKDQLYFTKSHGNILTSIIAKTGETVFENKRISGLRTLHASPVAAADRIYITDREGTTAVLQAGDDFKVLATNKLDEVVSAPVAIVDNELFLRGDKHLYCIAEE